MSDYPHDKRIVAVEIDYVQCIDTTVADVRTALKEGKFVEIPETVKLIISPYCVPDTGHVVFFNVISPTEWWGMCSGTGRKVVYKVKADKYVLFDENNHMTGSY